MIRTIVGPTGAMRAGKITDALAENSDIVVRFQGGTNAGHTIINDYGKFALHLLPRGVSPSICQRHRPRVALDVEKLLAELESLVSRAFPSPPLYISDRAQVMLPYHGLLTGTRRSAWARAAWLHQKRHRALYGDKYLKIGIQVCQLYDEEILLNRLTSAVTQKNVLLESLYYKPHRREALVKHLRELGQRIQPMVMDTTMFLTRL